MQLLVVLQSWMKERKARVAVGGKFSRDMNINNMVYQGTVLGPPLWNVFYADAAVAVNMIEFLEIVFADDLNCFKDFGLHIPNETLHAEMDRCQSELHKWGKANQVSFDPAKESQQSRSVHLARSHYIRELPPLLVPFLGLRASAELLLHLVLLAKGAWTS